MTDAHDIPATYNEAAPGEYSVAEQLKAQQEQTSASNNEPLHPELSDDSELTDPSEVGKKGASVIDTAPTEPATDAEGAEDGGSK